MYSFYTQLKADYQAKVADGTLSGSVVDDTYSDISYKQVFWTSTYTFAEWLSKKPSDYYMKCWSKSQINVYMNYLETAMAAVQALDDSNPLKVVYERHVLTESIFPRFVICMGNNSSYWSSGFNHSGASYWTGAIANARAAFKTDCTELGITKYAEHSDMSAVFTVWGV